MMEIIIIGILLSIIFYELTGISPGGIIVPGILVLYINQVDRLIYTVAISLITVMVVRLLSIYVLIYGKRRFAIMILISVFLHIVISFILKSLSISLFNVSIIGVTISGLIANEMYKQKIRKTLPAMIIVVTLLHMITLIIKEIGL
ncbi:MAG: poly-gamma-glutamate biosynthesis protein PgsC [Acholeplasmataceae bacterium]